MNADELTGDGCRDRGRGALLGLACGDAVGTTLEFKSPGTFTPIADMVGGGPFQLQPGQWTDDTSMALCLAESIVDTGELDLADQLRRFVMWWREGYLSSTGRCFDIGNTTSAALRRYQGTGAESDSEPDQNAAANGSLMRLAPVPIAWHRNIARAAELSGESSRSTHGARRPVDACRLMGAMIAALISGASAEEVFAETFWQWGPVDPEVEAIARGSYLRKEPPEIRGTGFCVDALEAALWAVVGADDFRDAVLRAANLGDDADTTAAIAGQLAGARWGASAIPKDWLSKLALRDRIRSLADALLDLEAPDPPTSWRHDVVVHSWWVEPGVVLAGEYPATRSGDPTKLDVLLDAGVRTFVDLTTPVDALEPYAERLASVAVQRGLDVRHVHRPIPDLGIVHQLEYRKTIDLIRGEVAGGRRVYVHCWGGVGRTGTVIGCLLAHHGQSCDDVVAAITGLRAGTSKAWRQSPETMAQISAIRTWCQALAADPP